MMTDLERVQYAAREREPLILDHAVLVALCNVVSELVRELDAVLASEDTRGLDP